MAAYPLMKIFNKSGRLLWTTLRLETSGGRNKDPLPISHPKEIKISVRTAIEGSSID
jgi:hypothetical protein